MKKLALIIAMFAGYAGTTQAAGDVEAGKAKAAICATCHGQDGNATLLPSYPKLAGQHASYIEKQLKEFRLAAQTGGKSGRNEASMNGMAMPLSDQDIADLAAYYAALEEVPGKTPVSAIPLGEKLYLGGDLERGIAACIACHGPRGNGGSLSGFPKISGQNPEYTKLQLQKFKRGERANDMNGMMRDIAKKLTEEEMTALADYLAGLH